MDILKEIISNFKGDGLEDHRLKKIEEIGARQS